MGKVISLKMISFSKKENALNMIGTSGWCYKGWENGAIKGKGSFYSGKSNLTDYAKHFNMVELNCTFYKTPSIKAVKKWNDQAPIGFKFLVKVNKYVTHSKKLLDWQELFPPFHGIMSNLQTSLLGYLIQLPPQMTIKNIDRVVKMAKFNKEKFPQVDFFIEFRHSTWFCQTVYDALAGLINIVFVNQYGVAKEMDKGFSPKLQDFSLVKNNKTFFRCHGTWTSQPYCGNYSDEDLMLMASLNPDIVCFDNTDSFEHQIEIHIPGKMAFAKTTDIILPAAVIDAKKLKAIC